jgi:serine/threonine protein kinase
MNAVSRTFELRRSLGRGTWGNVYLAVECQTGRTVALKVIRDAERVSKVERCLLEEISNPFIVTSYGSFISKHTLHICLKCIEGGDLCHHMAMRGAIPAAEARLYVAEIALGLHALHLNGIVYRDLKPENVLLCLDGFVKLCDFGLSAEAPLCSSICGTYEYLAPEVLRGRSYGLGVDWWALGILLFEMLFKRTPFYAPDVERIRHKILNRRLCVPDYGNSNVTSLLYGLLEKDPARRFGFKKIRDHPLFEDIRFEEVLEKKIHPPFKPQRFEPDARVSGSVIWSGRWQGPHVSFGIGERIVKSESARSICE